MNTIENLRDKIDQLDDQITSLYLERMQAVKCIGELKQKEDKAVYAPAREQNIIKRLTAKTEEDELKGYISRLYADVFTMSKAYQSKSSAFSSPLKSKIEGALAKNSVIPVSARVACQGVEGSYSNLATNKLFELPDITYFKSFDGVFTAVEKGLCTYGVLPIENSSTGSISQVYDLMRRHKFSIVASVRVHVKHSLCALKGADVKKLKVVYSHEQGLLQCAEYLKKLGVEVRAVENTAVAARMVAESNDVTVGAICSPLAAEIYSLRILEADVQDNQDNYTRFICVSKNFEIFDGADKISIVLGASHTPGSLYRVLGEFASLGLNLTKLESRPVGTSDFEFMFYFDFEANLKDARVVDLLARLTETNPSFILLGSYKERI